jgi:hypothetical protein
MQPFFDPSRKMTSKKNENGRRPQFFFEKLESNKMEDNLQQKMEDDRRKKWKTTSKKNGRQPQKKEDNHMYNLKNQPKLAVT